MKRINKIWHIVIVALVLTTSAFGQQRGQGGGGGGQQGPPALPTDNEIEEMVEKLASEISLDETQEGKVLELYKEHFKQVESKTKSGRPSRDAMDTLKKDFEKEVKEELTKEQQKLYITYLKKTKRKGRPQ